MNALSESLVPHLACSDYCIFCDKEHEHLECAMHIKKFTEAVVLNAQYVKRFHRLAISRKQVGRPS